MKTIRCINPKTYNLRLNAEYQTLHDTDNNDRYSIINDRGLERVYDAALFEDVVSTLTNEEIVASISLDDENNIIMLNRNNEDISFQFLSQGVEFNRTPISCGIFQFVGLNQTADVIWAFVNENFREESAEFKLIIAKLIFSEGMQGITEEISFASMICSTNINHGTFNIVEEFLDNRGGIVETMLNPNSNNEIKFWYITKEEITA